MNETTIFYQNGKMSVTRRALKEWTLKDFRSFLKLVLDRAENQTDAAGDMYEMLKDIVHVYDMSDPVPVRTKRVENAVRRHEKEMEMLEKYMDRTEEKKEDKTMKTANYFENVTTLEGLRTEYKNLLKANHPDNGGDENVMKEINTQYDKVFALLKSGAKIETKVDAAKWSDVEDAAIRNAIAAIIGYPGLNIEVVGTWVWVDGATYECKEDLKSAGYKWSRARKKWHFAPYEKKCYRGSKKSFEQLRREYGSTEIEENEKIA